MRLFSSLRLMVATPACEPGQDTSVTVYSRLDRLAPGQLPLLAERSPGATGLASSLSGCLRSQASGAFFDIAGFPEGFHGPCLGPRVLPGSDAQFVPPFGVFRLADYPFLEPPEPPDRADTQ